MNQKPVLLIDMDGVLADYYGKFLEIWKQRYPDRPVISAADLKNFYIEDAYGQEYAKDITDITRAVGFFESLEPVPGAVEALKSILEDDEFEAFICTAPELDAVDQCCFSEKARSIEKHFGREWLKRMIITKDKTVVGGDYIIDDKPEITGKIKIPGWQHIRFTHGYNKDLPAAYRLNGWTEWIALKEEILTEWEDNQPFYDVIY